MVCLILVLVILWVLSCVLSAYFGFWFGVSGLFEPGNKKIPKPVVDTDESKRSEREQRELYNMLTYDGTPQGKD